MNSFRLTQNQIGKNLFLLPNANGCNIELTPFPDTGEDNYEDVDDPRFNPDDDATYVGNDTDVLLQDLYALENPTTETGTINYVQVFARAKANGFAPHKDAVYKILLDVLNFHVSPELFFNNLVTVFNTCLISCHHTLF